MKLAIIGQSAFGAAVLDALAASGKHRIVGVFAPPDTQRGAEPLTEAARARQSPRWQFKRLRDKACIDTFTSIDADLTVMAYVTDIVPMQIIDAPTLGTIQYHPSLLPRHRGPSSINWAIINGDSETGLTIFWPDRGLDTGPVLLQKRVEILPDDTVGSIYFNRLFPMGVDAIAEAVELVATGNAPSIEQDESLATYESWCGETESRIDWSMDIQQLHDLIRGCDPQPGAWCEWNGEKIRLYGSRVASRSSTHALPGQILTVKESGLVMAIKNGSLKVQRVRVGKGPKINPCESGIEPGHSFD